MHLKGLFTPRNPLKYKGNVNRIIYRSRWEKLVMHWMDETPGIIEWNSEGVVIPYISELDGRPHKYYVDFWIRVKKEDGTIRQVLIEVKPERETMPPVRGNKKEERFLQECATYLKNRSKWRAAQAFCRERDIDFFIVTERTLKIGKYGTKIYRKGRTVKSGG